MYRFGPFSLDVQQAVLFRNDEPVPLPPKAVQTLLMLVASAPSLVTKQALIERIWPNTFVDENNLMQQISLLRKVLGNQPTGKPYIETIARRGYRFMGPVQHTAPRPAGSPVHRISIAVLPFTHASESDQFYALGLTDQITAQLGRLHERLRVVASFSSMRFGASHSIPDVARQLSADYVLCGTVQRVNERIRVTAKLIQVDDQNCVWAETFARTEPDIFRIQDEITRKIAHAVSGVLNIAIVPTPAISTDPATYEIFLKGCFLAGKWTPRDFQDAIECFQQVIRRDCNFAPANSALAVMYGVMIQMGMLPPSVFLEVKTQCQLALSKRELPEAFAALAWAQLFYDGDWLTAQQNFQRAIELNPNYPQAYHGYSQTLTVSGRHHEAITALHRAAELDPLSAAHPTMLACGYYFAGKLDTAITYADQALEMDPASPTAFATKAWIQQTSGDLAGAIQSYRAAVRNTGNSPIMLAQLAQAQAAHGDTDAALQSLEVLLHLRRDTIVSPYYIAMTYANLGDIETAMDWMEKAFEEHSGWRILLGVDPKLDALRSHPRFLPLLEQLQLSATLITPSASVAAAPGLERLQ